MKDTIELPGKPLTTNFLFLLFKSIMVKGLSLSLVSTHGTTFLRISDLLTQNVHLVQNTLHTYTVSTRKFDLNELSVQESLILMSSGRQLSVFGSFLWIMNYRLRLRGGSTPGERMLLAFCFWWRSSVLFSQ